MIDEMYAINPKSTFQHGEPPSRRATISNTNDRDNRVSTKELKK